MKDRLGLYSKQLFLQIERDSNIVFLCCFECTVVLKSILSSSALKKPVGILLNSTYP